MTSTTEFSDLSGRVAVVTGASSGIGEATARRLSAGGAQVAVIGRRAERIETLAKEIGGVGYVGDVSDASALAAIAARIRADLGPVDLVVANAGVMLAAAFNQANPVEWEQMLQTNITGLLNTGRAFIDDLLVAGAAGRPADLVHVGSIGGHVVIPTYAVYGATKAAVAHLTRNLRAELGPQGVRVRTVEPGMTNSELGAGMLDAASREFLADYREKMTAIPPTDIAEAIAWSSAAPARVNVAELIVLPTGRG